MKSINFQPPLSVFLTLLVTMTLATFALAVPDTLDRDKIADEYKWNLNDIYDNWGAWEADMVIIEDLMTDFVSLQGTLADGPCQILKANRLGDDLGKLAGNSLAYNGTVVG